MAGDWTQTHDLTALGQLDAAGRAEQLAARQALHLYVDAIWEAPKGRAEAPTASPAYDVVAACVICSPSWWATPRTQSPRRATRTRMTVSAYSAHVPVRY